MTTLDIHLQVSLTLSPIEQAEQDYQAALKTFYENDNPENFKAMQEAGNTYFRLLSDAERAMK